MAIRFANHYIRTPYVFLGMFDIALLMGSVYAGAYLFYLWLMPYTNSVTGSFIGMKVSESLPSALMFAATTVLCMGATGLFQPHKPEGINGVIVRIMASYVISAAVMALIFFIFPSISVSRGAFIIADLLSFILLVISRFMFLHLVDENILKRRILVYGSSERAATIFNTLRRQNDQEGFIITGFVHVESEEDVVDAARIIHIQVPLVDYAREQQIEEILVMMNDRRNKLPLGPMLECRLAGINVIGSMEFLERETGKINLEFLQGGWLVYTPGFRQDIVRRAVLRFLDVLVSVVILLVSWPFMMFACLAICLESGFSQPVLYRQTRVGLHNASFTLYKFRSMTPDAERGNKAQWAQLNDSRVTKVGAILRKYRIDELPQLFNVLRGDMSLVGPRPERPEFTHQLEQVLPYYSVRHSVKPGLAGWAQLNYPYGSSVKDAHEKLQYDLYYAKNRSLFLDFIILLQTVEVVLWGKGAR